MPKVIALGLGPAGPELITDEARTVLAEHPHVWLRTRQHPSAALLPDAPSFDDIYESADTIESVYGRIVDALVEAATGSDSVAYTVPGSPLVAERTVDLLRADPRVDVEIVAGMSFLDLVWARLRVDPLAQSPRLVDGRRFGVEAAGERGPLLVAQCDSPWVLSDVKLAFEDDAPLEVTVLQRLGLADESVTTIPWEELDRVVEPDHLTTLWIPRVATPVAYELARVDEVSRRLRRQCPWDREQTHESLSRYLIEESYELVDAIDDWATRLRRPEGDDGEAADAELMEELGDLFFQVFAHSTIAAEQGRFNIADVARAVSDKLIERHPHVYGDVVAETADDVMSTWESNEREAKGRDSVMDGIPRHLPALLYAWKVLRKAALGGVELSDDDVRNTGLGGALLLLVDEARKGDDDPEQALRRVTDDFRQRFQQIERTTAQS